MMRLRRASVIAGLSLLASAATAYAECAWVLWVTTMTGPTTVGAQTAQQGFVALAECEKALQELRATLRPRPGARYSDYFFTCLPDTVDPRGPKGK